MKKRIIREAETHLESPKADKPETTGEMPSKFKLYWTEIDDDGNITNKDKSFDSFEKFDEFKSELESNYNFLQIDRQEIPANMDAMEGPKSEEMEKVKLEHKIRKFKKLVERLAESYAKKMKNK